MPTKQKRKIPPNTSLKDGVFFNTQGDTIRQYIPSEERFINSPMSAFRPSKISSILDQSRNANIEGGLVERLPVNIPMRQQYGLADQKPIDPMAPYLPEFGFGSWIKDNGAGLLQGAGTAVSAIPIIGSIAGPILSGIGSIFGGIKKNKQAQADADAQQTMLDEEAAAQKEQQALADRQTRATNIIDQGQINYGGTFEDGGLLGQNSLSQPQITEYTNGQKHRESATNGIPVDARGNPATTSRQSAVGLTERGEVTWNGYVFSDKLRSK